MKSRIPFLLLMLLPGVMYSQQDEVSKLFSEEAPLDIKLHIGIKDVKGEKVDTVYTSSTLYYKGGDGSAWDSIKVEVRARGDFRRRECYYPPLRVKLKRRIQRALCLKVTKA